jgi:hypothetical protein
MLTRAYLRRLSGVDRRPVPHPDVYPEPGRYPTAYAVRDRGDAITVTLEGFVPRPAE